MLVNRRGVSLPLQPELDEFCDRGAALRTHQFQMPDIAGKLAEGQGLLEFFKQTGGRTPRPAAHGQRGELIGVDGRRLTGLDDGCVDDQSSVFEFEVPPVPQKQVVTVGDRHLRLHDGGA